MCLLTGKYIESISLFISFVFIRYAFSKTYHSNSFWNCIAISVIIFIIAITFVPNKNISLFSSVIFGLLIDYIVYKSSDDLKHLEDTNEFYVVSKITSVVDEDNNLVHNCLQLKNYIF